MEITFQLGAYLEACLLSTVFCNDGLGAKFVVGIEFDEFVGDGNGDGNGDAAGDADGDGDGDTDDNVDVVVDDDGVDVVEFSVVADLVFDDDGIHVIIPGVTGVVVEFDEGAANDCDDGVPSAVYGVGDTMGDCNAIVLRALR